MGSIGDGAGRPHLLVLANSSSGHIVPTLTLARDIAERGVIITFVSYEAQISRLESAYAEDPDFRLIGIPDLQPDPAERRIPYKYALKFKESFTPTADRLIRERRAGTAGGPTAVLADMFFSWSQELADALRIPTYIFIPSGAVLARFQLAFPGLVEQGQLAVSATEDKLIAREAVRIPSLPALLPHELVWSARISPSDYIFRCRNMLRAAGVVVNSCHAIEGAVMASFAEAAHGHPALLPVGPLLSTGKDHAKFGNAGSDEGGVAKAVEWLDGQPPASVVYVAFGTMAKLTPVQVREIGLGLEASGQRFLWVVPLGRVVVAGGERKLSLAEVLPEGYEGRVAGRGRVVTGWAPQQAILGRAAVGAFLTHAGWNSSQEGMIFGVPMIAWPRGAEQHLNARFMVDELRVAEEVRVGDGEELDRAEVERAVRAIMAESGGAAMRTRARELQRKIAEDMSPGGPRSKVVDLFARHLLLPNAQHHRDGTFSW